MSDLHDALAPDKAALAALGAKVRARLDADPGVYQVEGQLAEVYVAANFLTVDECEALMAMVDATAKPSSLYEETFVAGYRTSYSGDLDLGQAVSRSVDRRICDLLGIDPAFGERPQGQRYAPGQEYKQHYDWFDINSQYWKDEIGRGGQRSWTAMAYLNNVEAGGATCFLQLGIEIPPQQGALLIWNNVLPDGRINYDTLHAARPVEKGAKYVITKWFRTRDWT